MARNLIVAESVNAVEHARIVGPFADSNNNVYAFIRDTTNEALDAYKTSDPSGGSWTAQDTSNNPDVATHTLEFFSCFQVSNTIHIVIAWLGGGNIDYRYYTYHMSSHATNPDTWQVDELVETPTNSPVFSSLDQPACDLVVRSNGDVIVLYNGDMDKVMGIDYMRADYAKRTGVATWSTGNAIDAAGEVSYGIVSAVLAESDRVWFDYTNFTATELIQESINSSDTQQGLATIETDCFSSVAERITEDFSNLVYYDDDGTAVVCRVYTDNPANDLYARYTRGTTLQTRGSVTTANGIDATPCLAVKNKIVYCVFINGTNDVAYRANDDEGGWDGTDTIIHNLSGVPRGISARNINYGGDDFLGVIYYDPDTTSGIYYTEISIGAPPTTSKAGRMTLLGVQ